MRLRLLAIHAMLIWLLASGAVASGDEATLVDPFLQAAQWTEEAATTGNENGDFEGEGDLVACGDEVGMAGIMAPDRRQWSRWSALVDFPILLPSLDSSVVTTTNDHPVFGPRLSVGWESANGLGIRGRGWGFDNAADVDGRPMLASHYGNYYYPYNLSAQRIIFRGGKFDLDFYKQIELQAGYLRFGASLSAAQLTVRNEFSYQQYIYNYSSIIWDDLNGDYNPYYYGYNLVTAEDADKIRTRGGGLGLMAEGSHRLNNSPIHQWSAFGRGRIAYLVGEQQVTALSAISERDANMTIGEAALGLEYRRKFTHADLLLQCAFEVQSWDVPLVDRVNLIGVAPSVGVNW